jgi:4-alpha-glucanotransferase
MASPRFSAILLHPTSLPGPAGSGDLGGAARFLDLLTAMNQSGWQMLPLGPTGYGSSPYQLLSSFALNPMLADLDALRREGWLDAADLQPSPAGPSDRIDFATAPAWRAERLQRAADQFLDHARAADRKAWQRFCAAQADWLDAYALFIALKAAHGGVAWTDWPAPLARREPAALAEAARTLARAVDRERVVQFWLDRQWRALRRAARARGIRLIGDMPIFVAHDSADVWSHPELFQLDGAGQPRVIAGVPPDYFSATGQRWGNPLYDWPAHESDGFAWWIARMRRALTWIDLVRVDHFRGFAAYWEIPASEPTAVRGRWVPAPGEALFHALRAALGRLPMWAEDLGVITPDVEELRDAFRLPGMTVLPFALHRLLEQPPRRPEAGPVRRVIYTGTHDNNTTVGWFRAATAPDADKGDARACAALLDYLGTDGADIHGDLIRLALRSRARWAVLPLQDVLGLGAGARMNTPATLHGNWQWRFDWEQVTPEVAAALAAEVDRAGRRPTRLRRGKDSP